MNKLKETFHTTLYHVLVPFWNVQSLIVVVICALSLSVFAYYAQRANSTFADEYAAYASLADTTDNSAFIPGAANNPVRQDLNLVLQQVLGKGTKVPDRLKLSQQGLADLTDSKKQIDAITETADKVDTMIAQMQVDSLNNFASSDRERAVLTLAKQRASIVSDIRAYSYRADFDIGNIFNHIISDKGQLTDAYVIELNNEVPDVEVQFDKRSQLYSQLQGMSQKISDAFAGRSAASN
jgi:hypothetical protein